MATKEGTEDILRIGMRENYFLGAKIFQRNK